MAGLAVVHVGVPRPDNSIPEKFRLETTETCCQPGAQGRFAQAESSRSMTALLPHSRSLKRADNSWPLLIQNTEMKMTLQAGSPPKAAATRE